jgi:hypothetical protein
MAGIKKAWVLSALKKRREQVAALRHFFVCPVCKTPSVQFMKKTPSKNIKTKTETVTVNEFAEAVSLTPRRVRQLCVEEKKLPPIKKGRIELLAGLKSLVAFYQRTPEAMQAERLALVKATRETKQLELEREQGKHIELSVAEHTVLVFARRFHRLAIDKIETYPPGERSDKLASLGVASETVAAFREWDTKRGEAVVDALATECQNICKETPEALTKTDET